MNLATGGAARKNQADWEIPAFTKNQADGEMPAIAENQADWEIHAFAEKQTDCRLADRYDNPKPESTLYP